MAHAFNLSNQKSKASVCNFEINLVYLVNSKMSRAAMFQKNQRKPEENTKTKTNGCMKH